MSYHKIEKVDTINFYFECRPRHPIAFDENYVVTIGAGNSIQFTPLNGEPRVEIYDEIEEQIVLNMAFNYTDEQNAPGFLHVFTINFVKSTGIGSPILRRYTIGMMGGEMCRVKIVQKIMPDNTTKEEYILQFADINSPAQFYAMDLSSYGGAPDS